MHSLTIVFGPNGAASHFLFKERADADHALIASKNTAADDVVVKDDFGQHGEFRSNSIHARIIEDLASDAQIERGIQQEKMKVKFNNRATNDPALRMHIAGAPLNHPGMPNGQRRTL